MQVEDTFEDGGLESELQARLKLGGAEGRVIEDKIIELKEGPDKINMNEDKVASDKLTELKETPNNLDPEIVRLDGNDVDHTMQEGGKDKLVTADNLIKRITPELKEDKRDLADTITQETEILTNFSNLRTTHSPQLEKEGTSEKTPTPQHTTTSIIPDKKEGKLVSSKSPAVQFSEVEDERTIRVKSPLIKREATLSEPRQEDEKFDLEDLSFFDTPVNTQTDMRASMSEVETNDTKAPTELDKSASTSQGPVIDHKETLIKDVDKTIDQDVVFIEKTESPPTEPVKPNDFVSEMSKQSDPNTNVNVKDTYDKEKTSDSEINMKEVDHKSPENGLNGFVGENPNEIGHEKLKTFGEIREKSRSEEKGDSTLDINKSKSPVHDLGVVFDDKQAEKLKDESKKAKHIKIKSQQSDKTATSYGYSDDFEIEEIAFEKEKSQPQITANDTDLSEKPQRITPELKSKSQPGVNEDTKLLVEDISSADLFERNKTKSSIPETVNTATPSSKQDTAPSKLLDNGVDIHGKGGTKSSTNDKSATENKISTQNKPTSLQANKPGELPNPYFTGRLPSFGLDEGTHASTGNKSQSNTETKDDHQGFKDASSHKEVEYDNVSENKSTSRIIELIQEINAPAQKFQMTKERPLSPKTPSDKQTLDHQSDAHRTFLDDTPSPDRTTNHDKDNTDKYSLDKTNMKVGDINSLTSSMMDQYAKNEAPSSAKFDGFPHIQEISQYNRANKLADVPADNRVHSQANSKHDNTERPSPRPQHTSHSREHSNHSGYQTVESTTVVGNHQEPSQSDDRSELPLNQHRSSSENDLKAVVASAKLAYGQQITPSSSILPPLTREATLDSKMNGYTNDSRTTLRTTRIPDDSAHVLICSNCLHQDSNIESAGFCRECQQYLCGNCISLHKSSRRTKRHEIMTAYCAKELGVKKYVKATGYCVDCQHFLCMKCVINHTGYRKNRYHRIIQSSFISKPSKTADRSPRAEVHPSFTKNVQTGDKSERDRSKSKERKGILKDLDRDNHYRKSSVSVSESIYPGPDKKLGISYADNPKWPQASVPKLPYLLKPKTLQERVFETPYVSYQKSAFYTNTKEAFDPNKVKLRSLQSRYTADPQTSKRSHRRKEEGLFTARREKAPDGVSLPDIHTKPTVERPQKEERHFTKPPGLKKAKFLKEYCISVPFPSGERPADILAMAALPNGKILIADKHNNNVKLYNKLFKFKAMVKFNNRLAGVCSSNLCPVDLYVATQKHVFEITTMRRGLEVKRKMKVDIKRIEGVTCWKYGLAVVYKKTNLTWEVKLMDYRGNSKSKLEILNPFTQEIDSAPICYITTIKGGKRIILTDTKNACLICTDVTSRCVLYETSLPDDSPPSYVTSDNEHNVYVSCTDKIHQLSKEGNNVGTVITKPEEVKAFGCILYNRANNLMYVQTAKDFISVYQMP